MSDGIKAIDALRVPADPVLAERYCHEQIEILRQEFLMKAKPYIDLLTHINATKPIIIAMDFGTDPPITVVDGNVWKP